MRPFAAYAAVATLVLAGNWPAQAADMAGAQVAVLPAAMILPNVAAAAASSAEYQSNHSNSMRIEGVGGYNQPYADRRRHEEAYCSTRGLAFDSVAFRQCVAQTDAALFDRQFPIR